MDEELKNEDTLMRLRSNLNNDKVKLWLEPYLKDNVSNIEELEKLAKNYANELSLTEVEVLLALRELQSHSVERASANDTFKETGVALLRFKVPPQPNGNKAISLHMKLNVTGNDLVVTLAEKISVEAIRLKLIHRGSIIKRDDTLESQGVKNGAQILVVLLSETPEKLRQDSDLYSLMQTTRSDVELLYEHQGEQYMELEDQYGNRIELPTSERKALTVGMALHERGRKELKKGNYPLALVLLLEADKHFSECTAKILDTVDNYALLNLDIAWCYLCLQSITHIPDAQARLTKCEASFHRSYGQNLERLVALKGSSANEQALLMRLHLLQSIVLYHQNKRAEAKTLLDKAETELNSLKVDETALCSLMELGCSAAEARIGLRAQNNAVEAAYSFIQNMREERKANRKRAKEEEESRALGLCIDGKQYVSTQFVQMLQDMGYPTKTAILALKNSNNHVSNAVQIIQEQPHLLNEVDLPSSLSFQDLNMDNEAIKTLMSLGFDKQMVEKALSENDNMLEKAADFLVNNFQGFTELFDGAAGTSSNEAGASSSLASKTAWLKDKIKNHKDVTEAFNRLSEGMDMKDDDYLDLTLNQEEQFLIQYKNLLL